MDGPEELMGSAEEDADRSGSEESLGTPEYVGRSEGSVDGSEESPGRFEEYVGRPGASFQPEDTGLAMGW